ncbi:MAG: dihydroorotate dehydrogenase-like protein [Thermoanaerobaculaceae bacterium]|nr:dihydroorotate dehydrogenase-like protein [Thermoanaerobaculaceae bacterium]
MKLNTKYLGIEIRNPIIPAASLLTEDLSNLKKMEDFGAGAVILGSLFEEQVIEEEKALDFFLTQGSESFAEAISYFPSLSDYKSAPEEYLNLIRKAKESLSIPVIASLNGISKGGWIKYAKEMEKAGADAIELNIYFIPTRLNESSEEIERIYIDTVKSVAEQVHIPVAVKVSPYFSSFANMASKLQQSGAKGLVLFNRFYQPDFDIDELDVKPHLELSSSSSLRLALRWISILYDRIDIDFSATNGVHTSQDVVKAIMAGGSSVQVCAALYKNGIEYLRELEKGLNEFAEKKGYQSIDEMKGVLSQRKCPAPEAFERANYIKTLITYKR